MGETFVVDVACKTQVWECDPCPAAPPPRAGQPGRPRTRAQPKATGAKAVRVDRLTARRFAREARAVTIRDATKGPRQARVWVCQVWVWDGQAPAARARLLVVRQDDDGTCKYSLSDAPATTTWARLAYKLLS